MRLALIFPVLLLVLPARSARGQYTTSIGSPIAVELSARRVRAIEGKLTAITDDSIFIARPRQRDARLARGAVRKLYVLRDEGDMALGGALLGMDAGALVVGAGGALVAGPRALGRVLGGAAGAIAGGLIGLIAGGEIGSHYRLTSWVEAPWPTTAATPPAPPAPH